MSGAQQRSQHGAESEHHAPGHAVSVKILVAVWLALMVLTVFTVQVAGIDLGRANLWVAMLVASVKASLVVLFFMHLFWDRRINMVIFLTSVLLLALFLGMTLTDTGHYQEQLIPGYSPAMERAGTANPPAASPGQTMGQSTSPSAPASSAPASTAPAQNAPAGQEPAGHK